MHSHLIPGIDDGAKTMEDSLEMIRTLSNLGYQKLITTPHIMSEYYPNTPEIIQSGLQKVKTALAKTDIQIELEAAAEYYVDDFFEAQLNNNVPLLTFSDNYILIEFSMLIEPANLFDVIFQLNTRSYRPILAHPERYTYYANRFEQFKKIKSLGCAFQVNLLSLAGYYGSLQKKLGLRLLQEGLVDYLGTDLHKMSQVKSLQASLQQRSIRKIVSNQAFQNVNF